jgi:hypothetical protein
VLLPVKSRAHRCLKLVDRFSWDEQDLFRWSAELPLGQHEEVIGAYRNPGGELPVVVVTSCRLFLSSSSELASVEFVDIESVELVESDKDSAANLLLRLRTGDGVVVPFAGRDGKLRDVYSFMHFLDRLPTDRQDS